MKKNDFYKNFDISNGKGNPVGITVLISLVCSILGTVVVLYIALGIPSVRNYLLGSAPNSESVATSSNMSTLDSNSASQVSLSNYSDTAIFVSNKVLPSIVGISVEYTITSNSFLLNSQKSEAQGSGIIISSDGYILTNNHIINSSNSSSYYEVSKANSITVSLYNDEATYPATIIGTDEETDLAIIKIEKNDLVAAELGNSDTIKIGEFALAIGNPLGLQSSVTSGIISAVNRTVASTDGTNYLLIQTDAAINSGNSGGALVNSKGQVIGLNTLKLSGTGIEGMGFAIPINDTVEIYEQLIKYGKVLRPYIGISGINVDETAAEYYKIPIGVYVKTIEKGSSAETAGLQIADVITSINGTQIKTMDDLNKIKDEKNIGDTITLGIFRADENISIDLILQEKP